MHKLYTASSINVEIPQYLNWGACSLKYPPVINTVIIHSNEKPFPNKSPNGKTFINVEPISNSDTNSIWYYLFVKLLQTLPINGDNKMTARYLFTNQ